MRYLLCLLALFALCVSDASAVRRGGVIRQRTVIRGGAGVRAFAPGFNTFGVRRGFGFGRGFGLGLSGYGYGGLGLGIGGYGLGVGGYGVGGYGLAAPLLAAPDCGSTLAAPVGSCGAALAAPAYGVGGLSIRAPFFRLRLGGY